MTRWSRVANLDFTKGASALAPQMGMFAGDFRVAVSSDRPLVPDAADRIMQPPRDYFAPDALDSVYGEAVRLSQFMKMWRNCVTFIATSCLNVRSAAAKARGQLAPYPPPVWILVRRNPLFRWKRPRMRRMGRWNPT